MANNNDKKVLNVPDKRVQNDARISSAEREEQVAKTQLKGNVPALRFPEFTGEWIRHKLSEMCSFYSGGTPSSSKKEFYNGNIPFIRSGELHKDKTELFITEDGLNNSAAKLVETGDLLLALYGATSGDIAISKIKGAINQAILCIRTKQNKKFIESVWNKHVERLLQTYLQGGQGNLSADIVKNIPFYFANLEEQDKLANFISLLDERISTQNKIIEKLETLIKGIRHKIFKQLRKDFGFNVTIGDILSFEQPQRYIVSSAEYSNDDTFTPVLTANKAFILGYTTETDGIYSKGDCIIIDDFTLDCKYVSFPFKIKSSAIKILTAKNKFILRYTYEYLKSLELSTEEHKRHYIAEVQPHSCVLPYENTLKTIALVFENLAYKLANEQSLSLILNKQKQYLLSKMFI